MEEATSFLYDFLRDGPIEAGQVIQTWKKISGTHEKALYRAKKKLKIPSKRFGFGKGGKYFWVLPDEHRWPNTPMDSQDFHGGKVTIYGIFDHPCKSKMHEEDDEKGF